MAIDVKEALGQFEQIVAENEEKDAKIESLISEMEGLRQTLAQEQADNKEFRKFDDIILDKTPRKEWKKISINSSVVYKSLLLRAKQVYGNTRPLTLDALANHCLDYALSGAGFPRVVKTKIERPEDGS
jgi:hypothetical protein